MLVSRRDFAFGCATAFVLAMLASAVTLMAEVIPSLLRRRCRAISRRVRPNQRIWSTWSRSSLLEVGTNCLRGRMSRLSPQRLNTLNTTPEAGATLSLLRQPTQLYDSMSQTTRAFQEKLSIGIQPSNLETFNCRT